MPPLAAVALFTAPDPPTAVIHAALATALVCASALFVRAALNAIKNG